MGVSRREMLLFRFKYDIVLRVKLGENCLDGSDENERTFFSP